MLNDTAEFITEVRQSETGQVYVAYRKQWNLGYEVKTTDTLDSAWLKSKNEAKAWFLNRYQSERDQGQLLRPLNPNL